LDYRRELSTSDRSFEVDDREPEPFS
jgi:hypothetical protein